MGGRPQTIPEDLGPGTETEAGGVFYGDTTRPRVVIGLPGEREPGQPLNTVLSGTGCQRCSAVPEQVIRARSQRR